MELNIKYCNNIDEGNVSIIKGKLNIKYAINGTGKSTISKAIDYYVKTKDFNNLKPFKYKNETRLDKIPTITGIEELKSIMVFNDEYVNQYVYLPDELVKNSFEVFIKNEKYDEKMEQINELISSIRDTFNGNEELDSFIDDLKELSDCFGKSNTGYSAAGSLGKGLGKGNKLENIPEGLMDYKEYLKSDSNIQWLKWQMSGKDYLGITHKCPYCTTNVESKKETILLVSKEYDAKMIEHLNKVISVFERLNKYFTVETNARIKEITKNVDGVSKEQITFLKQIKEQVNLLVEKLVGIKNLGFNTLKDVDKITEIIGNFKIDLNFFFSLNADDTVEKIKVINISLEVVIKKAGILQGEINSQKSTISKTIQKYKIEINDFLKYAGYNYNVDIESDKDNIYKMKLKHNECLDNINDVKLHLSYGEKNAFALVLFMYEALKNSSDLIILDDPISSFDKNKKFAIIDMLFRGKNSFRGKTVLMFTHDFDPIIDIIYNLPHKFEPVPSASFLANKHGQLKEIVIKKDDIKTFIEIASENIKNLNENINKLIYLRRLHEISNKKGEVYHLISNLMHKREVPIKKEENGKERNMLPHEIESAIKEIESHIPQFNYLKEYNKLCDNEKMISIYRKSNNNYEKLQLYRAINNTNSDNDIISKFVKETYHIENDYLFQLNPCKYEIVPQYIIDECDKNIASIEIPIILS